VGNESDVDVFFDDVSVEHRQGLQVQETEYDPAGLELAGLAPASSGIKGLNNHRFNGKEFQADLGLTWNHQDWRFLDPQILRWHVGDPEMGVVKQIGENLRVCDRLAYLLVIKC